MKVASVLELLFLFLHLPLLAVVYVAEIEHYSVAYFHHITAFEVLQRSTFVKDGAHMHSKAASMPDKST